MACVRLSVRYSDVERKVSAMEWFPRKLQLRSHLNTFREMVWRAHIFAMTVRNSEWQFQRILGERAAISRR